jgi:toxin ParE1/3/4
MRHFYEMINYVRELRAQCRKITQIPQAYRPRTELGKGMRSRAHGNYVVLFYEEPGLVRIIRVLHPWERRWPRAL